MSQVIVPYSLVTPVTIANGGTGGISKDEAITNLSSPAFNTSAQSADWGALTVFAPVGDPDTAANQASILDIINALTTIGVIV